MINEVAPPGWGHTKAEKEKTKPNKPKSKIGGTAQAMQKAQKRGDIPKNMNIFALMWSMKNKGDNPHYKPGVKGKLKGKYKGPEGQNEMIDPKKIRNYKNVSNAVVAKADKEAEKVKDKEQKGTLEFPQMPTEESTWSKNFKKQSALRRGQTKRRQQAGEAGQKLRITPAGKKALKKGDQKLSITAKGRAAVEEVENEGWGAVAKFADSQAAAAKKKKETAANKKVSSWAKKEDMSLAPKGKGRKAAKALYTEEDIDMPSLVSQAMNKLAEGEWADSKAQEKKDSDRLIAIQNKREANYQMQQRKKREAAAKKEDVEIGEDIPTPKFKPLRHKVWSADASIPAGARPKNPGKIKKYKASGAMPETVSDFGNKLRQAIEEAKKVNAIDTINKIVKTKTMGKLHGQKVDLFTASAIQQVYNALNKKNQEKMTSVMSKDVHGLLKMADFSMKQMKR